MFRSGSRSFERHSSGRNTGVVWVELCSNCVEMKLLLQLIVYCLNLPEDWLDSSLLGKSDTISVMGAAMTSFHDLDQIRSGIR